MKRSRVLPFLRARDGASIVEFAVVIPVFLLLVMGITEFGLFMFHKVVIESVTMQAAREVSLGKKADPDSPCQNPNRAFAYIRCYVREKTQGLIRPRQVIVRISPVARGGVEVPDICLDHPRHPTSKVRDCTNWEEQNNISGFQGNAEEGDRNTGHGGQLMELRVSYPWRLLTPMMGQFIGDRNPDTGKHSGTILITASTVFRNEPTDEPGNTP